MKQLLISLALIFFFLGCSNDKLQVPAKKVVEVKQPSQINIVSFNKHNEHTPPKKLEEVKEVEPVVPKVYDFNGSWQAQATSSFTQRKLTLKKVNNSLQGQLQLRFLTSYGQVYDIQDFEVVIYLKFESIEGFISKKGKDIEKLSLFRDSEDSFTIKIDGQSKYFDENVVRFVKYKDEPKKVKAIKYEVYKDFIEDKTNGLIWQDSISNTILKSGYYEALEFCKKLNQNGFDDWYLPTKKQLQRTINNNIFQHKKENYWSQTASQDQKDFSWYVDYKRKLMSLDKKTSKKFIRCIRKKTNEKNITKDFSSNSNSYISSGS